MEQLSRLDLNLVPLLAVLLEERSVSRAASRVRMSQPSASKSLARLRRHFDDELLVRTGKEYQLTALGRHLAPLAAQTARALTEVVQAPTAFEASGAGRDFTIAASEYGQLVAGPSIVRELGRSAPKSRVRFVSPFTPGMQSSAQLLARVDGWLSPKEVLEKTPSVGSIRDEWVLVTDARSGPPEEPGDLERREWVLPVVGGQPMELQLGVLRANGIAPVAAVTTESFASIPFLVAGTDRVGLVQGKIANRLADAAGVHVLPFPHPVPPLHLTMWWDESRSTDAIHQWFRGRVADAMSRLDEALQSEG